MQKRRKNKNHTSRRELRSQCDINRLNFVDANVIRIGIRWRERNSTCETQNTNNFVNSRTSLPNTTHNSNEFISIITIIIICTNHLKETNQKSLIKTFGCNRRRVIVFEFFDLFCGYSHGHSFVFAQDEHGCIHGVNVTNSRIKITGGRARASNS